MQDPALAEFGQLLIARVRDKVIREATAELQSILPPETLLNAVSAIADATLRHFLFLIETSEAVDLTFQDITGRMVSLKDVSDGLSSELHGDGWIAKFSKFK